MLRPLFATVFAGSLLAQGQFVVDASNGPGTDYLDIQPAVLAVPGSSTLLVRAGSYSPVLIDNKAITILCDANVTANTAAFAHFLTVRNIQPSQTVTVRGLQGAASLGILKIEAALGPVTYDGANGAIAIPAYASAHSSISGSNQVAIENLTVTGPIAFTVASSSVVFESCVLNGANAMAFGSASFAGSSRALELSSSDVQLVHSSVFGGNGFMMWSKGGSFPVPGSPAIGMAASSLRAMGLAVHGITGGSTPNVGPEPSIVGSGTARIEPQLQLAAAPAGGISLTRPTMPSLLADSALPGGVITARRHGAPGVLCAVALSLRGASFTLPGLPDAIWLDGPSLIVEAAGITPTSGPFVVAKTVPNQPALRGFQFVWQAADLDPTGIVAVSNPSPSFVR